MSDAREPEAARPEDGQAPEIAPGGGVPGLDAEPGAEASSAGSPSEGVDVNQNASPSESELVPGETPETSVSSDSAGEPSSGADLAPIPQPGAGTEPEAMAHENERVPPTGTERGEEPGGGWNGWWVVLFVVVAVGAAWWGWDTFGPPAARRAEEARQLAEERERERLEAERLARARGGMTIRTEPAGAMVTVWGPSSVGPRPTPAVFEGLRLGRYRITVSHPEYEPETLSAEVEENRIAEVGPARLTRSRATVRVTTTVEPAIVEISGWDGFRKTNEAPALFEDVPAGRVQIRARRGAWETVVRPRVAGRQTNDILVEFWGATVILDSVPGGAQVWDGLGTNGAQTNWGVTPLVLDNQEPGVRTFRLERSGFAPELVSMDLVAGGQSFVERALVALGQLWISTQPTGAVVFVGGAEAGVSPLRVEWPAGDVELLAVHPAHPTVRASARVESGRVTEVALALSRSGASSGRGTGILVPGRPGFLRSPFAPHAGLVEARDVATGRAFVSGTEVRCPFTGKVFLVP